MLDFRKKSLRGKIVAALLPALLPMLLIVLVSYLQQRNFSVEAHSKVIDLVVRNGTQNFSTFLRNRENLFNEWVHVDVYGASLEYDTLRELGDKFREMLKTNPAFDVLALLDLDGKVKKVEYSANQSSTSSKTVAEGEIISESLRLLILQDKGVSYLRNHFLKEIQGDTIIFHFPTKDSSGKHNGVFLASLDRDQFQAFVKDMRDRLISGGFPGAKASLLEKSRGDFFAERIEQLNSAGFSSREWLQHSPSDQGFVTLNKRTLYIKKGSVEQPFLKEREGGPQFVLATFVPEEDIMQVAQRVLSLNLIIAVSGTMALFILLWIVSAGITKSIRKLLQGTKLVEAGDYSTQVNVDSDDEIGTLALRFNSMTSSIHENITHLRRLQTRLESILIGTKDLASARNSVAAAQKTAEYILKGVLDAENCSVSASFFEGSDGLFSKIRVHELFRAGIPFVEAGVEIPLHLVHADESSSKEWESCSLSNGRVLLPVVMHQKRLCMLMFDGYKGDEIDAEDAHFMNTFASSLAVSLENISYLSQTGEKAKLEAEFEATRAVQEQLLPVHSKFPNLEIATHFKPALLAGGDWYGHYYDKTLHRMNFFIGDVTGHGIASALITGVVCGGVYAGEHRADLMKDSESLHPEKRLIALAQAVNSVVYITGRQKKLMTMAFVSLDLMTGEVLYLNAGHSPIYFVQGKERNIKVVANRGSRLGFAAEGEFSVKKIQMQAGDVIFMYTDGLIENSGPENVTFRERQLKSLLASSSDVHELNQKIISECEKIWQSEPPMDDVTTLVVQWKGPVTRCDFAAS